MCSSAFGAAAPSRNDQYANGIDESIKQQALAEEEAILNQYKVYTFSFSLVHILSCQNELLN